MELEAIISEALDVLKRGGLILYPTDTIWGIGCDATNEEAVTKVFALKRRSGAKSLVLLASDLDMVARYVKKIPPMAVSLVEVNDAPMTLVYPGAVVAGAGRAGSGLAPSAVAEDGSVGIRIPRVTVEYEGDDAPSAGAVFCNKLVYKLRRPIVSTSANISGEPAPAGRKDVAKEILDGVDYAVPAWYYAGGAGAAGKAGKVWFDDTATGRSSQIIALGENGEVEIIRP